MAAEGYVPSNSEKYPLGGIVSAVQNAFGATPQVVCSHGAIEELRLCFYKDFKVCSSSPDVVSHYPNDFSVLSFHLGFFIYTGFLLFILLYIATGTLDYKHIYMHIF